MTELLDVQVRGGANAEEIAAVLAVLARSAPAALPAAQVTGLDAWRATRRAALAATGSSSGSGSGFDRRSRKVR